MLNKLAILTLLFTAACADDPVTYYEDVAADPELSTSEIAELPDGLEPEHHDDLEIALGAELAENDASAFDDDGVESIVDVEVIDTETVIASTTLLRSGLHPRASDALRSAGGAAWRITQTIGNAAASAGTHARDGYVNGRAYSAATDISVSGMSSSQIANLLERMAKLGFAAWYRHGGYDGWYGANHIHAVYANAAMKSSLRSQVRSWLAGRNGLVSNTTYQFHHYSAAAKAAVKAKYSMSHQGTTNGGSGVPGRVNTAGAPLTIRASASSNAAAIGSLPDGAYFAMSCQKHGLSIHGTYGTSSIWDRVQGGYVADAFVATGSDGQVAPTCP
ncbi:hypothetical protein BH11MYX3_BH11MYX3_03690 [soil metagenome]